MAALCWFRNGVIGGAPTGSSYLGFKFFVFFGPIGFSNYIKGSPDTYMAGLCWFRNGVVLGSATGTSY